MTDDDATAVRDRMAAIAEAAPPVSFGPAHVLTRGRRGRRRRTYLAVAGTAVALALVVAVPAAVLGGGHENDRRTLPAAPPAAPPLARSIQVSPAEAKRIVRGCALTYAGRYGRVPNTPQAGASAGRLLQDVAKVYNVVRDQYGSAALVYAPHVVISCFFVGDTFNASGAILPAGEFPYWLYGPVTLDSSDWIIGGDILGARKDSVRKDQALITMAGRVSEAVASVVVRHSGRSIRVTPVNGTYLVRFLDQTPVAPAHGLRDTPAPVTAYDAAGRSLGGPGDGNCYTAPDGHVVMGARNKRWPCLPATRWP